MGIFEDHWHIVVLAVFAIIILLIWWAARKRKSGPQTDEQQESTGDEQAAEEEQIDPLDQLPKGLRYAHQQFARMDESAIVYKGKWLFWLKCFRYSATIAAFLGALFAVAPKEWISGNGILDMVVAGFGVMSVLAFSSSERYKNRFRILREKSELLCSCIFVHLAKRELGATDEDQLIIRTEELVPDGIPALYTIDGVHWRFAECFTAEGPKFSVEIYERTRLDNQIEYNRNYLPKAESRIRKVWIIQMVVGFLKTMAPFVGGAAFVGFLNSLEADAERAAQDDAVEAMRNLAILTLRALEALKARATEKSNLLEVVREGEEILLGNLSAWLTAKEKADGGGEEEQRAALATRETQTA